MKIKKPLLKICLLTLTVTAGNLAAQSDPFANKSEKPAPPVEKPAASSVDPFSAGPSGDPFSASPPAKPAEPQENAPEKMISVFLEYIQLDHLKANNLMRSACGKRDHSHIRKFLDDLIKEGEAELVESLYIVGRHGQRTKSESVEERIYPTEFDPPELPQSLGNLTKLPEKAHFLKTAATPTAFEMRPVGATLEVDLTQHNGVIDINIAPELVEYLGEYTFVDDDSPHDESKTIKQPSFYTLRSSSSTVSLLDGETTLLATYTPAADDGKRILLFLKANIVK